MDGWEKIKTSCGYTEGISKLNIIDHVSIKNIKKKIHLGI